MWAVLAVMLSLKSFPSWTASLGQIYESIGRARPFSYAALGDALLGHAATLPALAAMLACAYGAGWPLRRLIAPRSARFVRSALQLAGGWSIIAIIQHGLGLTGLLSPALLKAEGVVLLVLGAVAVAVERTWRKIPDSPGQRLPLVLAILVLTVVTSLTRLPDTHEDPRVQHFAAPENFLLAHKIHAEPNNSSWHNSLGYEMVVIIPWALGGITAAKLVNIGFVLTTFLLLHCLVGALQRNSAAGWWACLWYVAAGLVMDESWQGKNDIAVAMYVTGAAWCTVEAVRGQRGGVLGAAWFLGAAAGVKYSAAFFLAALVVPAYFYVRSWLTWDRAGIAFVLIAIPVVGWPLANMLLIGNPVHPFLTGVFDQIHWGPFYENALHDFVLAISPPEALLTRDWLLGTWRILGEPTIGSIGIFILLPIAFLSSIGREPTFLKIVVLLAYLLWLPTERGARYLAPLLPIVAAMASIAVVNTEAITRAWLHRGRIALAGVAVLLTLLNSARFLAPTGWLHLCGQVTSERLLNSKFTTWDDVRRWINDAIPPSARILFTGEDRRLWFRPRVMSYSSVAEPILWRLTNDSFTIDEVRKRLHQRGITHHLYNFVSADYRETLWFPGPPWRSRQLALYKKFVARYYDRIYASPVVDNSNGGFYILHIRKDPAKEDRTVHYLPFTEGRFRVARNMVHLKMFDAAWAEAVKVAKPLRDTFQAQYALAKIAQERKDWETTFALVEPGIKAGFVSDGNWIVYAVAALMTGRHEIAIDAYVQATRIFSQRDSLVKELAIGFAYRGLSRYRQKKYAAAWKDFEYALRKLYDEPSMNLNAALALGQLDRLPEAVDYARRAARQNPDDKRTARILHNLETRLQAL